MDENEFTKEFKIKKTFDRESHLKSKEAGESGESDDSNDVASLESEHNLQSYCSSMEDYPSNDEELSIEEDILSANDEVYSGCFKRKFKNVDQATCWLNSCLQLILNGFDYMDVNENSFSSELGKEILHLKLQTENRGLDPTGVKNILSLTDDTRVAER